MLKVRLLHRRLDGQDARLLRVGSADPHIARCSCSCSSSRLALPASLHACLWTRPVLASGPAGPGASCLSLCLSLLCPGLPCPRLASPPPPFLRRPTARLLGFDRPAGRHSQPPSFERRRGSLARAAPPDMTREGVAACLPSPLMLEPISKPSSLPPCPLLLLLSSSDPPPLQPSLPPPLRHSQVTPKASSQPQTNPFDTLHHPAGGQQQQAAAAAASSAPAPAPTAGAAHHHHQAAAAAGSSSSTHAHGLGGGSIHSGLRTPTTADFPVPFGGPASRSVPASFYTLTRSLVLSQLARSLALAVLCRRLGRALSRTGSCLL